MSTHFCGKPIDYWLEMEDRINHGKPFEVADLLIEVRELRGKVSFYEDRIKQMTKVMEENNG